MMLMKSAVITLSCFTCTESATAPTAMGGSTVVAGWETRSTTLKQAQDQGYATEAKSQSMKLAMKVNPVDLMRHEYKFVKEGLNADSALQRVFHKLQYGDMARYTLTKDRRDDIEYNALYIDDVRGIIRCLWARLVVMAKPLGREFRMPTEDDSKYNWERYHNKYKGLFEKAKRRMRQKAHATKHSDSPHRRKVSGDINRQDTCPVGAKQMVPNNTYSSHEPHGKKLKYLYSSHEPKKIGNGTHDSSHPQQHNVHHGQGIDKVWDAATSRYILKYSHEPQNRGNRRHDSENSPQHNQERTNTKYDHSRLFKDLGVASPKTYAEAIKELSRGQQNESQQRITENKNKKTPKRPKHQHKKNHKNKARSTKSQQSTGKQQRSEAIEKLKEWSKNYKGF